MNPGTGIGLMRLLNRAKMSQQDKNEIAKKTEAPLGTIKAQLFRARELLFEILKDKKSQI